MSGRIKKRVARALGADRLAPDASARAECLRSVFEHMFSILPGVMAQLQAYFWAAEEIVRRGLERRSCDQSEPLMNANRR